MNEVKVSVTQEHIDKGRRGSSCSCPIALALRDEGLTNPNVQFTFLKVDGPDGDRLFGKLPREASSFIRRFDYKSPVEPLDFEIELMPYAQFEGEL